MVRALRLHGKQVALVVVLLASLSTVAFGGGYRASQAVLDDGAAWLVKGRSVALVNGDTGRPDAEVARDLATGRQPLEVVRTGTGVYVVNHGSGAVTRIDTATMEPAQSTPAAPKTTFVAGGGRTYVVDRERAAAQEVDPTTLQPAASVPLEVAVQDAAVDDAGVLWVLGADGDLVQVRDGRATSSTRAGNPGSQLTMVGGRPVVVDPETAEAVRWGAAGGEAPVAVLPLRGARAELAVPGPGPALHLAVEGSGELVAVDLDDRRVRATSLGVTPVTDLGRPVVSRTRIAVPDFTGHRLLLLARDDLRIVGRIPVPTTSPTFSVAVQGDRFYATDPFRRTGVVVEADGTTRPIDKGEGHGVSEPAPPKVPAPPAAAPPVLSPPLLPPPAAVPAPAVPVPPAPVPAAPARSPDPAMVSVPDLVGAAKEQACAELERLGLSCRLEPTGEAGEGEPGTVVSTDPPEGTEVPPGTVVAVRHLGDTTVPRVVDLSVDAACAELEKVGLVCDRSPDGQSAPQGQKAFLVLSQSPSAGQSAPGGASVSVAYHDKVTPDDYVGRSDDEACAALREIGLRCQREDAGSNAGKPEPVGQVIQQDPAGGSAAMTPGDGESTGDVVRVFRYTHTRRAVGNYTGTSPDAACAAARADGFTCVGEVRHPYRRPDIAYAQAPAAGEQAEAGAQVTVYYEDRTPYQLKRWKKDGEAVWVISADPNRAVPPGYTDLGATDLGLAYSPGQPAPDGLIGIVSWQCSCQGHTNNHYYGTNGASPGAGWSSSGGLAGYLFGSEVVAGEMVQVHRYKRVSGGSVDYAYAAPGSGEQAFYAGQGFVDDGLLGFTWRP